jgi:hypothetical protein
MASKSSILRLLPLVEPKLSRAIAVRLKKTIDVVDADGKAILADVLGALYPVGDRDSALTAFRQFRAEVKRAASEASVQLSIETDGQTRTAPSDRVVWFEARDRVDEAEKRRTRQSAAANIRDLRKGITLGPDLTIRDLIHEGRRF